MVVYRVMLRLAQNYPRYRLRRSCHPKDREERSDRELLCHPTDREETSDRELLCRPTDREETSDRELLCHPTDRAERSDRELLCHPTDRVETSDRELLCHPTDREERWGHVKLAALPLLPFRKPSSISTRRRIPSRELTNSL